MKKRYPIVLGLSLLAALVVSGLDTFNQIEHREKEQVDHDEPDFYMTNGRIQTFDQDGVLARDLVAQQIEYYGDDDSSELTQPEMTVYDKGQATWQITAGQGVLFNKKDEFTLTKDVHMKPLEGNTNGLDLTTQELMLYPERQEAHTQARVDIVGSGMKLEAVGMNAFLKQEKIQFLSKVRGQHEPH
jgi:lipopolysaccharide export system protein LptC